MTLSTGPFASGQGDGTTWSGPALLVPMTIEALVLTNKAYDAPWSWATPNYGNLAFFQPVEISPFTAENPSIPGYAKFTGVVLHWALPDGLTHGIQSVSGTISYPSVPNRWLVVRKNRDPQDAGAWVYQAWIVASDYVGTAYGSSFPNAQGSGAITVGMSWPLDEWPGESVVSKNALCPPLTALGAGDPTFAAYVPNIQSILSFADPLTGVNSGPLSYSVYGWYANPTQDPLYGQAEYGSGGWQTQDQWQTLMTQLQWSVGDELDLANAAAAVQEWAQAHGFSVDPANPRTQYPSRILCHGLIFDVCWQGSDGPYISGVPTPNPQGAGYVRPQVAIGNSGIDALAALIAEAAQQQGMSAASASQLVNILEAFQYNDLPVLDRSDAQAQLDLLIQTGWFNSTGGGTSWDVVSPQQPEDPIGRAQPPLLTPDQATLLTQLNTAQQQLDACQSELASLQWQVYALWWKQQYLSNWVPPPKQANQWLAAIERALPLAQSAVLAQVTQYLALRQRRDDALMALLPTLDQLTLVAGARPPFWRPNDPVIMITGAHRSYKHGEDGRFADDGTLFCRFTGQTISGIQVQPVLVTAQDVPLPEWNQPDLPLEVPDLDAESFFLDITNGPLIATKANPQSPWPLLDTIWKEQTLIWNPAANPPLDQQTIAEISGLQSLYNLGALPSKVGVEVWAPPWSPLYIDWSINYYPGAAQQASALQNWTFPSSSASSDPRDDFTYHWDGQVPPSQQTVVTIQGRTFLTPQTTDLLAARLEQVIDQYGSNSQTQADMWALQAALQYVENADLLSQALSGFNLALLERDPQMFQTAANPAVAPYLDPCLGPSLIPDSTPNPSAQPIQFNPIRGGHISVQQLWVVDGFGQVFDVLGAMNVTPANFYPILGTDLSTRGSNVLAELKPRITQFSRLSFDLLSADDDSQVVGVATAANPICGWLIPNHLDRSVMVYDTGGNRLGELLLSQDRALWLPPPDAGPPPGGGAPLPVLIANRHLYNLVMGILNSTNSFQALQAFLSLIDTAYWSIDPTGGWADQELPVLIGRPLAVVRAGLHFELIGDPAYSQLWDDTGGNVTDGFETARFPVQLGSTELLDDGLVGYYLNDQYQQINSVYTLPNPSPYVASQQPQLSLDGQSAALLTLVLDPQTKVNAITGVLPPRNISLPAAIATPALEKMEITFRTGPVLNDPSSVAIPLPALSDGQWSWLQYAGTTAPAAERAVLVADAAARLPDAAPVLREGWLKLILDGVPTRFMYTVAPTSVAYTTDPDNPSTVTLQFSVYNGSGNMVTCSQLAFVLPIGENAGDITAKPELVIVTVPQGTPWSAQTDGAGTIIATPIAPATGLDQGETISFNIDGVQVNQKPGTAQVMIHETTDTTRDSSVGIAKLAP